MICQLCEKPIEGQTFGAVLSDVWCMPCWYEWKDRKEGQERIEFQMSVLGDSLKDDLEYLDIKHKQGESLGQWRVRLEKAKKKADSDYARAVDRIEELEDERDDAERATDGLRDALKNIDAMLKERSAA